MDGAGYSPHVHTGARAPAQGLETRPRPFLESVRQLTTGGKVCLGLMILVPMLLCGADWTSWVALPFVFVAPVVAIRELYWKRYRKHRDFRNGETDDQVVRLSFATFGPGAIIAIIVESVFTIIWALLFLQEQLQAVADSAEESQERGERFDWEKISERMRSTNPAGSIAFVVFTAFITASLTEEVVKAAAVRLHCWGNTHENACCLQHPPYSARGTLSAFLAAAVGFSFVENCLYVFFSGGGAGAKILLAVVRGGVSMPAHVVSTMFTGIRVASQDLDVAHGGERPSFAWARALWPAVLVHGFFDLVAFALPVALISLNDVVSALITLLVAFFCVLAVAMYFVVKQGRALLQREDSYVLLDDEEAGAGMRGAQLPVAMPVASHEPTRTRRMEPLHVEQGPTKGPR